jgi:glycosyltransferase involved in cell wall biosynthesis
MDTRIYIKECLSLSSMGLEVHLIAPSSDSNPTKGVVFHGVSTSRRTRFLRMTKTIFDVFKNALNVDADIYHFHDPELIAVGLLFKMRGKKVIYDVHEDVPRQILNKSYIPFFLRRGTANIFQYFENAAAPYFDALVTATPFIRDRFLALGCNAVDVNNYPILGEFPESQISWDSKFPAVCYAGSIASIRGIFEMIEAVSRTNVQLLLAGKFAYAQERDRAIKLSGWKSVRELGYLDRVEVSQTLSRTIAGLVVLHPVINYLDALPVKMFEYMAAGIPVIASNFPLWQKIIEDNQCGICIDPLNPEDLAKAIQWLIEHPEEAERMGKNGRLAIETKYNWNNESQKLLDLYRNLLPIKS